jgi:hypothetical protein
MLVFSIISVVLADTKQDPNTIYVIIGVVILFFIIVASSSGSEVKTEKKYCPYCARQVNYPSRLNRPKARQNSPGSKDAFVRGRKLNNPNLSSPTKTPNPRLNRRISNDPIIKGDGKMLCPHCRRQL